MEDKPLDCKYKIICKYYKSHCYELKCWRAINFDGSFKEGILEKLTRIDEKSM